MKIKSEVERITKFIKDQVRQAKATGVVVGISGGVDSAVVAALCVRAVKNYKVLAVMLPYGNQSTDDSYLIIEKLNIHMTRDINIKKWVDEITGHFVTNQVAKGNVMARIRMVNLYRSANIGNMLVVGTGNRSELVMGYFTKYGDGGCDIAPISHLYKTEVWKMAKYLGIPKKIIKKKPSAELWEGQTDEKEMGITYKELDKMLDLITHDWTCPDEIVDKTNIPKKKVMMVLNKIISTQHKRSLPAGLKRDDHDG